MKYLLNNEIDKNIFYALECGLPITDRPFATIGLNLGLSESKVLERYNYFLNQNIVRRFGGIFDHVRFGYTTTLCAVKVDINDIDKIKKYIDSISEITHCYIRSHAINLWFTFSAHKHDFKNKLNKIKAFFSPNEILCLTALNRYKISVIFDIGSTNELIKQQRQILNFNGEIEYLSEIEKQLVKKMWTVPAISKPFEFISQELDLDSNDALNILRKWKKAGVLKRIALVPFHYKLGYNGNIMCVWKVPTERINLIGRELSKLSEVTHCYERECYSEFDYNLFAMIHGNNYEETLINFQSISNRLSLTNGLPLLSTKEIKKTSLKLFQ